MESALRLKKQFPYLQDVLIEALLLHSIEKNLIKKPN